MKKVLSVITCSVLAACSCSENQWEEVDVVNYDDTPVVDEQVVDETPVEYMPGRVVVEQEPVYMPAPAPQPAYSCPCAVQTCYTCYQPCPCMQQVVVPAPQPKVTTTRKVITTTTTIEEPCGKPVCEPVVTTHEEVVPVEESYNSYNSYNSYAAPVTMAPQQEVVEVTVEKTPYRSEIVDMKPAMPKVSNMVAAKYSPEAYDVVATRATNRMLQDSSALYANGHRTIHVRDTRVLSSDLPTGANRLKAKTKDIISDSKTFDIINDANNADFILDSTADWYVTNTAAPALQYKLSMFDKSGQKINEWVEIIRQVQD